MRALKGERGQASVEYLVVGLALIAAVVGIAVLWRFVSGGGMAALAVGGASHAVDGLGGMADVVLY